MDTSGMNISSKAAARATGMGGGWAEYDFNALAALGHRLLGKNCETLALARRLGCFVPVRRAGAGVLMKFGQAQDFSATLWLAFRRDFEFRHSRESGNPSFFAPR